MSLIANIFVFFFGSIVGSFLNVCIYRIPRNESVVWPRSHCPLCNANIRGYDNIPFISYLVLLGRCRSCKKPISPRYFTIEFLTALSALWLYRSFGLSFDFFFYFVFLSGLIIATFVDISHRIIPDEVSIGGIGVGLLLSLARGLHFPGPSFNARPFIDSFLGTIVGGGIIYLTGFIFDMVYFKLLKKPPVQGETTSMGGGDVKLLAMIGAFLGWKKALVVFFISPFFGVVIGLINLIVKKDHVIPYGPFLSLAAVLSIFWADKILVLFFLR